MDNIETKVIIVENAWNEESLTTGETKQSLQEAGHILQNGGLVAFPTETVYGIGANALNPESITKIYKAKGRPSDNPLIMHINHIEDVSKYVLSISDHAKKLMEVFWPGPLTLIFKKNQTVPDMITGGLSTVAIRNPKHPLARKVIEYAGVPIAAPSANLSGKPSPTEGKHVVEDLTGRVDMIIDGGKAELGLESTVLDVTSDIPCILRPGSITKNMLEEVVGEVSYDQHLKDIKEVPKSPGMKYKHYAPQGNLTIVSSSSEDKVIDYINIELERLNKEGKKVGVITPEHAKKAFICDVVLSIGNIENPEEIGSNLFTILREMDSRGIDEIFSFEYPGEEVSVAVMNRLMKAAGYRLIQVDE